MYQYRPVYEDYILLIYYEGKKYRLRLKKYHTDRQHSYWHLVANNRVIDLKYNRSKNEVTEELLTGQPSSPKAFLDLLEQELKALAK